MPISYKSMYSVYYTTRVCTQTIICIQEYVLRLLYYKSMYSVYYTTRVCTQTIILQEYVLRLLYYKSMYSDYYIQEYVLSLLSIYKSMYVYVNVCKVVLACVLCTDLSERVAYLHDTCNCKSTCNEEHYKSQIAIYDFPNDNFFTDLYGYDAGAARPPILTLHLLLYLHYTYSYTYITLTPILTLHLLYLLRTVYSVGTLQHMHGNVLSLTLSYRSLSYDQLEEYLSYTWMDVIG